MESLLSLAIFSFLFLGALAFLGPTKLYFHGLIEEYESRENLYSAADKIKFDLEQAGQGLFNPLILGLIPGIKSTEDSLKIESKELEINISTDLQPGQTRIPVPSTNGFKENRLICIFDTLKGQTATIASIDSESILLSQPLQHGYKAKDTWISLVKTVEIFFETDSHLLRRKVNSSSAQPLLENTEYFSTAYNANSNYIYIEISTTTNQRRTYAITSCLKNVALAYIQ